MSAVHVVDLNRPVADSAAVEAEELVQGMLDTPHTAAVADQHTSRFGRSWFASESAVRRRRQEPNSAKQFVILSISSD